VAPYGFQVRKHEAMFAARLAERASVGTQPFGCAGAWLARDLSRALIAESGQESTQTARAPGHPAQRGPVSPVRRRGGIVRFWARSAFHWIFTTCWMYEHQERELSDQSVESM